MHGVTQVVVFIAFVVSLIKYNQYKNTTYKYFCYLLGVTLITEITAYLFGFYFLIYNVVVYNIFIPIVNLFYYWFYKKLFKSKRNQKLMNVFSGIFIAVYLYEIVILKNSVFKDNFTISLITGAILTVITLILYLIEIVHNEKIMGDVYKHLIFWITIGSLLFYVGIVPIFINAAFLEYRSIYTLIISALNITMYGSFIIGYFVSDPNKKI